MKKTLSIILAVLIASISLSARDRVSRDINQLPAPARTFLKTHFPKTPVNHIKIDKEIFESTSYDVILNNGSEIEFDSKGEWKEIDCGNKAVPKAVVLNDILKYVNTNFPKRAIVKIEKSSKKYEVELSDGTDLEFGRDGKFRKID